MQSDKKFYSRKATPPLAYEVGGYTYDVSGTSALNATLAGPKHTGPFHGVELQAYEMCPKNFIIFDQTDNKSRIMFHPAMANKFNCPSFDIHATCAEENGAINCNSKESSSLKEDTKDIDALLSLEEEDDDEEEVSTGRTVGNYGNSSPDSYSTSSSRPRKMRSSIQKSFPCSSGGGSSSSGNSEKKRRRMKKMLTALRGIVPGGDRMDSVTVLDEAVRYLKSLKVEVKKLGIGNSKKN